MNVTLAPELEAIVDEQIRAGKFENKDDVIAAGLLLLDQAHFDEILQQHDALKRDVQLAIDQSARGESKPFDREATLRRARASFERQTTD